MARDFWSQLLDCPSLPPLSEVHVSHLRSPRIHLAHGEIVETNGNRSRRLPETDASRDEVEAPPSIAVPADAALRPRHRRLRHGNPSGDPSTAQRCGAKTRRGTPCECPSVRNRRRCRLHGGLSTGPRTPEGRERHRKAVTKHGHYSKAGVRARAQRLGVLRHQTVRWLLAVKSRFNR
jgi:hypothetical protein